jgi:rhodanese-related sulfurtransferase
VQECRRHGTVVPGNTCVRRVFGRCRDYAREVTISAVTVRTALLGALLALVLVATSCATSSEADGKVAVVDPREAVTLVESGEYVVLDLRSTVAFEAGHVVGSVNVPFSDGEFGEELDGLDPEGQYLIYSRRPADATKAADHMVALGFDHVVDGGAFGLLAIAGAEVE